MGLLQSVIITNLVQKIKENFKLKDKKQCVIINIIFSLVLGMIFSLSFSSLNIICCLWSCIFSFMGADTIYKILEGKLFKSFSNINCKE